MSLAVLNSTVLLLIVLAPNATKTKIQIEETPRDNYVLSVRGPSRGNYTLGMGGSWLYVLPSVDFRWIHGVSDLIHSDVQLKTIGVLNVFDAAARFRLVNGEYFSLALSAGALAWGVLLPSDGKVDAEMFLSGGGGVILSFGPEWLQWTVSSQLQVGYNTHEQQRFTTSDSRMGVEFPVAETRNMFIEARLNLAFHAGDAPTSVLPMLSMGVAW